MQIPGKIRSSNYRLFVTADALVCFALGLLGPFWVIYMQDFEGSSMESLGFAIGLRIFAYSLTSYFVGALSDRFGRTVFIVAGGAMSGIIMVAYTMVISLAELYVLQIVFGVVGAMQVTATAALLGDLTERESRGRDVGKMSAATGIAGAVATVIGGITVGKLGIEVVFYVVAGFFFASPAVLLFMKGKRA